MENGIKNEGDKLSTVGQQKQKWQRIQNNI
jgi:hypothetical protein